MFDIGRQLASEFTSRPRFLSIDVTNACFMSTGTIPVASDVLMISVRIGASRSMFPFSKLVGIGSRLAGFADDWRTIRLVPAVVTSVNSQSCACWCRPTSDGCRSKVFGSARKSMARRIFKRTGELSQQGLSHCVSRATELV